MFPSVARAFGVVPLEGVAAAALQIELSALTALLTMIMTRGEYGSPESQAAASFAFLVYAMA
ncbi:hypothetical protein AWV79_17955 [Cupriavidus sp. UYMMa02A]|nr:hypothetical protein AWV79_17955 [Cupriavidus sp. UYMMa02A]